MTYDVVATGGHRGGGRGDVFRLGPVWSPEQGWVFGLINAVAVLIIARPCAGVCTPMSIMVAAGGATSGVLFRDAAAIGNLRKVDTLIVNQNRHAHRGWNRGFEV
jgi:cation transport ATPase